MFYWGKVTIESDSGAPRSASDDRTHFALDLYLKFTIVNEGPLKSSDTFLLLKPDDGFFNMQMDKEIVTRVHGTKPGTYQWSLNKALSPTSEVSFRADYHCQAKFIPHPSFRLWYEVTGHIPLEDMAVGWIIFADSAPPQTGKITMRDIGLIPYLNQVMR